VIILIILVCVFFVMGGGDIEGPDSANGMVDIWLKKLRHVLLGNV